MTHLGLLFGLLLGFFLQVLAYSWRNIVSLFHVSVVIFLFLAVFIFVLLRLFQIFIIYTFLTTLKIWKKWAKSKILQLFGEETSCYINIFLLLFHSKWFPTMCENIPWTISVHLKYWTAVFISWQNKQTRSKKGKSTWKGSRRHVAHCMQHGPQPDGICPLPSKCTFCPRHLHVPIQVFLFIHFFLCVEMTVWGKEKVSL